MTRVIQQRLYHSFAEHSSNVAAEYGARSITYAELDRQTNRIANYLIEHVPAGATIGVLMQDRLDSIITMVGILKARCVFMPLEASLPEQRLAAMLATIQPQAIIVEPTLSERLSTADRAATSLTLDAIKAAQPSQERPAIAYDPEDRVYIYHTSGSTGTPKAIIGKNISLLHFLTWEIKTCAVDATFRCSQFTNIGFDVFLRDTLMPLCAGACLCIPQDPALVRNSVALTRWIEAHRITLIHCVPSIFALIDTDLLAADAYRQLKYILLAGEKVRPERLRAWFRHFGQRVQLVNLYGPTETTLAKAYHMIQEADQDRKIVPIGKPIAGAQLLIFNQSMELCDVLEPGEIYIRTPFMSHGYFDAALNTGAFVPHPLSDDGQERIYKTGDLGRLLPDGNIELLGRVDRQIKIRGIRVELEEIEQHLSRHPAIHEAVVMSKEVSDTNQLLWACVTLKDAADKHDETLIPSMMTHLAERLPQYMVPASILVLDELPRKINGKIDYSALQNPPAEPKHHVAPRDALERRLLEIWQDVLGVEAIGIDESFFEKGGHSLNLMHLILRLSEEFQIEIKLEQIALENTIERLAALIRQATGAPSIGIARAEPKPFYPLTAAQRRIYFLQRLNPESTMYHLPSVVELRGPVDPERLEAALQRVVQRHATLRTAFALRDNQLVQIIQDHVRIEITQVVLDESQMRQQIAALIQPFDLGQAPLMRAFRSQLDADRHMIVFDFHHSIFDGLSKPIFFADLVTFYNQGQPEPLELEYQDYAEWQQSPATQARLQEQEAYWLDRFRRLPPRLALPEDGQPGRPDSFDAGVVQHVIDGEQLRRVRALAQCHDTTLFTVLLTVCTLVLSRASGNTDIAIGVPTSGRNYQHLDKLIGMFVNTVVLRSFPGLSKRASELLAEIKASVLQALEHQDYQFDDLVRKLNITRDTADNPLFDVMFQLQQRIQTDAGSSEVQLVAHDLYLLADFKLTFSITEDQQAAVLTILYRASLFRESTVDQLARWFAQIIDTITTDDQLTIGEIHARLTEESSDSATSQPLEIEFDFDA